MVKKCIICIFTIALVFFTASIYALSNGPISQDTLGTISGSQITTDTSVEKTVKNVWATVANVVQILAVAAVVLTGVRYMFASADTKADIKKQTIILIVGAVFVFASIQILEMISNALTGTTGILK